MIQSVNQPRRSIELRDSLVDSLNYQSIHKRNNQNKTRKEISRDVLIVAGLACVLLVKKVIKLLIGFRD